MVAIRPAVSSSSQFKGWLIFNTLVVLTSIAIWFISVEETNVLRTRVRGFLIGSTAIEWKLYACSQPNHHFTICCLEK
ncbi:hypothetical protein CRE_23638 [Caenorhabditis remanei]|uniref:Uncharacterized protein n=1 Tax=Caenorhabditis remanei TaxID=31234 RepID=E3N480_CAERE|nr:hypothetical protein CRE_23638 [Caenorhabditis remanei]